MSRRLGAVAEEPGRAVHLNLLQGFQLECSEIFVDLPLGSQRVLAFLALRTRPQSRSYAASILWMDCDEERAAASLRSALWRINRSGHRFVTATSHELRLMPDVVVDLWKHARTAHEVLRSDTPYKDSWVEELALAGDLLPGWDDEWVIIERERFRQLRLHALERLCGQLTAAGRFSQAIETGLAAVSSEPLRESAHRALIGAYLEEGNSGEAIRQYQTCRQILRRELGIEPSPVTRALLPAAVTRQHASRLRAPMGNQVATGATLQCSLGTTPSTFAASGAVVSATAAAGVVTDISPSSVPPFGLCQSPANPQVATATAAANGVLTPQPCQPVLTPWTPGSATVTIGGVAALDDSSQCSCSWAGQISVSAPSQTSATLG